LKGIENVEVISRISHAATQDVFQAAT
jgi:hypothetical protein